MGGELRVESTPGQGSRFFFDLPLQRRAPRRGPGRRRVAARRGGSGSSATAPATFALPSPAEVRALLTLSLEGDIVRLRERLKELASRDAGSWISRVKSKPWRRVPHGCHRRVPCPVQPERRSLIHR